MEEEGVNPRVTMEVFPSGDGILCGMREVLALLGEALPSGAEVWALAEGEPIQLKETVLRITAPYLSFGIYETAILGILAHESGWATAARQCVEAAKACPSSASARATSTPRWRPSWTTRPRSVAVSPAPRLWAPGWRACRPPGTMPHAMILCFGDTVRAALAFDKHMPPDVPRIVLVDTFHDEPEEALQVAEALGDRLQGVRLDTPGERGGVTPDLVKEARARLDLAGFPAGQALRQRRRHSGAHPRVPGRRGAGGQLRRGQLHQRRPPHRLHRRHQGDGGQAGGQARPHPRHHRQPSPSAGDLAPLFPLTTLTSAP